MKSALRESWRVVRLKEVCEKITVGHVGPMANEYVSGGVPFLRSQNIHPFKIDASELKYISADFHKRLSKSALRAGDVAIVRTGYPGTAAVIPSHFSELNCADLVIVRPSPDLLDPWFLTCIFNSTWGRGAVAGNLVGVAQQHFNVTAAKEMQIRLPDLATQQRIASILSAYDDLIENNTRRIAILEEMARRIYEEWFVRFRFPGHDQVKMVESELGLIPEGWSWGYLRDVAEDVRESVHPEAVAPDTPYVGLEHIPRRSIALAEWGFASEVQSTKLRFVRGDILFGKIRPYFHKVAVAPVDGVASSDAIVIRARESKWYPLVLATVSSDAFVAEATQSANGTKMPRANWNVLLGYKVPKPTDEVLSKFNEILLGLVDFVRVAMLKNRNLRATRDLLLPKLISGELDVSTLPEPEEAIAA